MPDGGTVHISTARVHLTEPRIDPHGEVSAGDWAVIRCRDTGPGIEASQLARLFEPVLSSKGAHVETGLGLAVTLARLQQLNGHVSLRNHVGGGLEATLWVPRVSAPEAAVARMEVPVHSADASSAPASVATHVLLVDDDALVLRTAERLLVRAGFRVTAVGSGFEALDALDAAETAGDPIENIVTDVIMPGLSGPEFVAKRRQTGRVASVVYMSGYTGDSLPASLVPEAGAELVSKPFSSATLVSAIRAAMARRVE
ncbi:MAG TPA: response regulator [Gammaproteobacteria bacterium]|nr:response regulator [Gammaproteobacteria bacterium]